MARRGILALLVPALLLASACAAGGRPAAVPAPPRIDWRARLAEADALGAAGHYTALRDALGIYREAAAASVGGAEVAGKLVRTAIAFELRKRELGVLSDGPALDLDTLAAGEPSLVRYGPWLELLSGLPVKVKGNPGTDRIGGRTLDAHLDWVAARVPDLDRGLGLSAPGDELAATLRLALRAAFPFKFEDQLEGRAVRELHPGSRLVAFQSAMFPAYDFETLDTLLAAEPGFAEIDYFLGEAALLGGKLLTAERRYLAVHSRIPESLSVLVSLAKVAFQVEELESCLEWNEKALAVLPTYRDALLGKGLALGYLGRNDEALAALGRLLELGTYYMGEGHFWTAWNLNELGRLEEARRAVEAAAVFLVDIVDVHTLSGIIAYRQGRLDDAEKALRRALDLNASESDAAYYLGRLYADRGDWLSSGIYFAGAALSLEEKERGLEAKIGEIEASEMPAERRARLAARKRAQVESVRATKATCQYNGAAGYHNAGSFDRALDLARLAAEHPAFAGKAAELIRKIQER